MAKRQRLNRLNETSLADRAKDMIRDAIFEGKIRPEERLTIERIADELGISRTPVREALKALESDGVVRLVPRRGAIIAKFSKDEFYDRYSVRAMIEGYAGALACDRQPKSFADKLMRDCEALSRLIKQNVSETAAVRPLVEANATFHERILQASGSTTATRVLEMLRMPVAYRAFFWQMKECQLRSLAWHEQIAAAFERQEPSEVRRLMEAHLLDARDYLMSIDDQSA